MAEDHPSRYVKLTKDQAPLEEIKPGELNQPIDVPQVQFVHLFICILWVQCLLIVFSSLWLYH